MALLDFIGTSVKHGATPTVGTYTDRYFVQGSTEGGADVDQEDVFDADGARKTRLIFRRDPKVSLDLVAYAGTGVGVNTEIVADFPIGDMATLAGLTAFFVDDCKIQKAKGAWKIAIELTNIGIT